jgi:hypothetical protein
MRAVRHFFISELVNMEALKAKAGDLIEHGGELLDTYYRLTVVNATEKVAKASSTSVLVLAAAVFGLVVIFFAGIGLAWWIGESMDNMKAGFFIVGGFFLLLLILLLALRKSVILPMIRNLIIQSIYDKSDSQSS